MDLHRRIAARQGEFMLFAMTPPRACTTPQQAQQIADIAIDRLRPLDLDGLILYDIADEAERNGQQRPFPFLPTLDPADYVDQHLTAWPKPVVIYRATAKYTAHQLRRWIAAQDAQRRLSVFVGAASRDSVVRYQPSPSATDTRRGQSRSSTRWCGDPRTPHPQHR